MNNLQNLPHHSLPQFSTDGVPMQRRGAKLFAFSRESGQGLFALLVLLLIVGASLIYTLARPSQQNIANDKQTAAALAQAKAALIGYAAIDANRPGELPCPDVDNDGASTPISDYSGSNCVALIGRLPWVTLDLPDLRDGSGERLWYALSNNFHANGSTPINSDTLGQLNVTGTIPINNVIAIVFAPGRALGTQVRDSANQNNPASYLEGGNESGNYVTGVPTDTFNDRLLTITSDDLFPAVELRVTQDIRNALQAYYKTPGNGYYPYANDYADPTYNCTPNKTRGRVPFNLISCPSLNPNPWSLPSWFAANGWNLLVYYTVAPACTVLNPNCLGTGFITVKKPPAPTASNVQALVIAGGRALASIPQPNPCVSVANCLESIDGSNPPDGYINAPVSGTFNDKITIVGP
jgi:hypothetical protein